LAESVNHFETKNDANYNNKHAAVKIDEQEIIFFAFPLQSYSARKMNFLAVVSRYPISKKYNASIYFCKENGSNDFVILEKFEDIDSALIWAAKQIFDKSSHAKTINSY
jgi:hypothetical protein